MDRKAAFSEARRLYVDEGHTYAEAAQAVGLPISSVQKRGARDRWRDQRQTASSYQSSMKALKAKLLAEALETRDPQVIYAWRAVEKAYPEARQVSAEDPELRRRVLLDLIEEFVAYLAESDANALTVLEPHITPFVERLEGQWAA